MLSKQKLIAGILLWVVMALVMVRDMNLLTSDPFGFSVSLFFGLLISYHIVAYLFGWDMLTIGGLQIKRGEHDVIRAIMFLIFIGFWLWGFFSF